MIWFTSDTHFRHKAAISIYGRKFNDIMEMDDTLIKNWNKRVGFSDTVYFLGDFCFGQEYKSILNKLNGYIHFLIGDQDEYINDDLTKHKKIMGVYNYYLLKHSNQTIILSHYPFLVWDQRYSGAWHLHGHTHLMQDEKNTLRFNVSVDKNIFSPVSFQDIENIMKQRKQSVN